MKQIQQYKKAIERHIFTATIITEQKPTAVVDLHNNFYW